MTRRDLLILSLLLPVGCTVVSWVVFLLRGESMWGAFAAGGSAWEQLAWGTIIGLGVGALANAIEFDTSWFRAMRDIARQMFARIRPRRIDLLVVSAGAGWGEELLFRGALQPVLGIWWTAVIFALSHGLLTKPTWGRLAYTVVLLFAGVGLGYLANWKGLGAAMVAHGVYDFVVLLWAHHLFNKESTDNRGLDVGS